MEEEVKSDIEEMDEDDKMLIADFHKMNISHKVAKEERPQTSKGFRKKVSSNSELDMSTGENLF